MCISKLIVSIYESHIRHFEQSNISVNRNERLADNVSVIGPFLIERRFWILMKQGGTHLFDV